MVPEGETVQYLPRQVSRSKRYKQGFSDEENEERSSVQAASSAAQVPGWSRNAQERSLLAAT